MTEPTVHVLPKQRQPVLGASRQERVQAAVLLQIVEHETANWRRTTAVCPGTDHSDFEAALRHLLAAGSLAGPKRRPDSLAELAEGGWLTVTERGLRRLCGDDM